MSKKRARSGATGTAPRPQPRVGARDFTRKARRLAVDRRPNRAPRTANLDGGRLRATVRRVPITAWVCALVACLNAVCWSFIVPPFQVPDEPAHFAYVQQLAETGTLPTSRKERYSLEEAAALQGLRQSYVHQRPEHLSTSSQEEQRQLDRLLGSSLARTGPGDAGVAGSEPPLYYALAAIPYSLGSSESLLARLELIRLLSALFGGLTALFVFMFVREALPGEPWAWSVGGLSVATVPLLGFMAGAVNPDAMLFAVTSALFYALARAFRRGLSLRSACAIGALMAVGLLTKLNFLGILPGALLGLALLARAAARTYGRLAYVWLMGGVAIAASPAIVYAAVNLLSDLPTFGVLSDATRLTRHHGSIWHEIAYLWQLYLPRLPGMPSDFVGHFTTREIWFNGYIGLYGWFDTTFPGWVYNVAVLPAALIAIAGGRALVIARRAARARLGELIVYAAMTVGVMMIVGMDSYLQFPQTVAEYGQARYMLPMLTLLGAWLALAARGFGKRWGPVAGALIVVLFFAHDIFSQMQVIARYHG